MNNFQIKDVSDTALMAATYRAAESGQSNALFHDQFAGKLAGERGRKIVESLPSKAFIGGWSVVIRTHIIDDFIQAAIAEGVDTVLNLGAGLDARPYRLELPPELHWIEFDYPHVIELKERCLSDEKPRCHLKRVKLDLADIPARQKLFETINVQSKKALILTEAVIPYLSEDSVASLGADLRSMDSVKYWVTDYFSPASYRYRRRSGMSQVMKNAPFLFEPEDYFSFFAKMGWKPKEVRYFPEEGERLDRPAPFPLITRVLTRIMGILASPERRREMNRYSGVVLFEIASDCST